MTENWRPVVGHEGSYEVSDLGRVRSLDRTVVMKNGMERHYAGCTLVLARHKSGHLVAGLGREHEYKVHKLVLEAFDKPAPTGFECRHLNGREDDNRLTNLQWSTRSQNHRDRKWHKGTSSYVLSPSEAAAIKHALAKGGRVGAALARKYGVSEGAIYLIKIGRTHTDVEDVFA